MIHDVDHTNEESITFVLVMPKSQKVPTRKTYSVLVMPLHRKDLLYRFAFVLAMPQSQKVPTRKTYSVLARLYRKTRYNRDLHVQKNENIRGKINFCYVRFA